MPIRFHIEMPSAPYKMVQYSHVRCALSLRIAELLVSLLSDMFRDKLLSCRALHAVGPYDAKPAVYRLQLQHI